MSFRSVFLALVIGFSLILAAFLVNRARPRAEVDQPSAAFVKATGKCADCHSRRQYSVVHEFELSRHARENVNCLDCHQPAEGQEEAVHHGFTIAKSLTAANCRACHEGVYQQYLRSRHAAPSWAAVYGREAAEGAPALTAEQVAYAEQFHPGSAGRPPHPLAALEGGPATAAGCVSCHAVGRPNADGTIGSCTACHTRHTSSVEVARLPTTCGQCHMGPDHSQLEIYNESRHGVMFEAQRHLLNLGADPEALSTRDMFVPTCATCHMSGLNGLGVTHDPSERLSYNLFAEVSDRRPNYARGRAAMKDLCRNCHTQTTIDRVYEQAEAVVEDTNVKVKEARALVEALRKEGLLPGKPFETPLDFTYFDLWHYYGRTSKHGAFMGGADFVQWHGNYPMLQHSVELKHQAEALRKGKAMDVPANDRLRDWLAEPRTWLEGFVLVNLAFLAVDIAMAHSLNEFRHPAEWVPLYFSVAAPPVLALGLLADRKGYASAWRDLGYLVGWLSVAVGLAGVILHLGSRFFDERTIRSLVYAAPFAAPLAYTGLGLLLIANRMVPPRSAEWPRWVLFLALGGFVGNFVFSLTDHAQNGFFYVTEWIPVVSGALAVGFLTVPFLTPVGRPYLRLCAAVLAAQGAVGVLGFVLHTAANLEGPAPRMLDNFIGGAPALAPLLFPNLVLLAAIGLWPMYREAGESTGAGAAARTTGPS